MHPLAYFIRGLFSMGLFFAAVYHANHVDFAQAAYWLGLAIYVDPEGRSK